METDRLIIRRFTNEDAEAVLALSLDRMNSSMKNFDHQWPTDLEGCKGAAAYFAGNDTSYAVCLKPSMELIGYISYNSVTDDGILDLGHVWHAAYQNNDHDTEALSLMTQYAFEKLGVNGVTAGNPLDCEEQIAPLKAIGMEVVEIREKASFVNDENGNPIEFTGCKMLITKKQWETGNPESYSPKNKPEILNMMEDARQIEKLIQTIDYKGVEFELVGRSDVTWVGCVAYANNNTAPAFSDDDLTLIKRFQGLVGSSQIKEKINPDWSASLYINYTCNDKPCGIMFANESYTDEQDERYDIFTQPGGLWLRVKGNSNNAKALLGKENADLYEFFGALREAAKENGYIQNPDIHVEVEYHCHAEYSTPPHTCYAYIPVIETPESYSPKNKPVILEMVGEASVENKPEIKAAASTIKAEERNTVRIMELPACKMVTSGPANGEDAFAPGGNLARFHEWFTEYAKQRTDQFYPRNFMWSPPGGGFQWGFAVDEIPANTNGLEVIDFPGGLYAKEYKDMHFVFGYGENGKTLYCCPFLDGDDKKNCSFNFQKYYKRKNRTAHLNRLIVLEETSEKLNPKEVYRQSLNHAFEMMSKPSPNMEFMKLKGAGIGIYDAWIKLLQQANAENSDVYYMNFPVFPQFIILYENRLHFCEFLKVCAETYGGFPELMELIGKCEKVRDLAFEDAEIGFHRENGDPKYHTITNNERRNLLIGVLEKCRDIDRKVIAILQKVCEVF